MRRAIKQLIPVLIGTVLTAAIWLPQANAMTEYAEATCRGYEVTFSQMPGVIKSATSTNEAIRAGETGEICSPMSIMQTQIISQYGDISATFTQLAGAGINIRVNNVRMCQQFFMCYSLDLRLQYL